MRQLMQYTSQALEVFGALQLMSAMFHYYLTLFSLFSDETMRACSTQGQTSMTTRQLQTRSQAF